MASAGDYSIICSSRHYSILVCSINNNIIVSVDAVLPRLIIKPKATHTGVRITSALSSGCTLFGRGHEFVIIVDDDVLYDVPSEPECVLALLHPDGLSSMMSQWNTDVLAEGMVMYCRRHHSYWH